MVPIAVVPKDADGCPSVLATTAGSVPAGASHLAGLALRASDGALYVIWV